MYIHVGAQINIYRNDTAVMVFSWGSKNTWIMMKTNSLKERKQSIGFLSFLLWFNTSLSSKMINYKNQIRKNKNNYWWKKQLILGDFSFDILSWNFSSCTEKHFSGLKITCVLRVLGQEQHSSWSDLKQGLWQWFDSWRAQLSCKFQWRQSRSSGFSSDYSLARTPLITESGFP